MKGEIIKICIFALGIGGSLALAFAMIYIFFTAYFNDYQVLITINEYKEAHIEFYMMLFLIPCMFYAVKVSIDNCAKQEQ